MTAPRIQPDTTMEPTPEFVRWISDNVPLYFNYGDKAVSYTWHPDALAADLLAFAPLRRAAPAEVREVERLRRKLEEIHEITQDVNVSSWAALQNVAATAASALTRPNHGDTP